MRTLIQDIRGNIPMRILNLITFHFILEREALIEIDPIYLMSKIA